MNPATNLERVALYLKSVENGDFAYIANLFSPDAVLEQLPNRIYPNGVRSGITRMAEAFEKGRKLLSSQRYEIRSCVAGGDELSIEVLDGHIGSRLWQPIGWVSDACPLRHVLPVQRREDRQPTELRLFRAMVEQRYDFD